MNFGERGILLCGEFEKDPEAMLDPGAGHVATTGVRQQRSVGRRRHSLEPVADEAN